MYNYGTMIFFTLSLCRQTGQATSEEIKSRDLRRDLEDKEDSSRHKRQRENKPRSFTGKYLSCAA